MATTKFKLTFTAEIKQVSSKKLASNDIEYRIILDSPDGTVMNLGQLDGEQLFDVTIEAQE